jgi:hypothetical protein
MHCIQYLNQKIVPSVYNYISHPHPPLGLYHTQVYQRRFDIQHLHIFSLSLPFLIEIHTGMWSNGKGAHL